MLLSETEEPTTVVDQRSKAQPFLLELSVPSLPLTGPNSGNGRRRGCIELDNEI